MRRRTRLLAGTFALVAMTFALAETVIAASCMPGMDMGATEVSAMDTHTPQAPAGHHDQRVPMDGNPADGTPADGTPSDGDERDCPFGPTVVQGCAGAASLPAQAAHGVDSQGALSSSVSTEPAQQDLLLVTALFHPPRA